VWDEAHRDFTPLQSIAQYKVRCACCQHCIAATTAASASRNSADDDKNSILSAYPRFFILKGEMLDDVLFFIANISSQTLTSSNFISYFSA